jgi:hypothetical protein
MLDRERTQLLVRLIIANAIVLLFLWSFSRYFTRFNDLVGATDWGSDWRWLQDGYDRLAKGLPLTRPEYVTAPWTQFPPPGAPTYAWSLHPPYSATVYAPMLLVPADVRQLGWVAVCLVGLVAALLVAWPRRLWWGTGLLIVTAFLHPPIDGLWLGIIDQVHYGNPNAFVALGFALVWVGRRRDSVPLMAFGLFLASLKILPAVSLGFWLLVAHERPEPARRSVFVAVLACAALTVPVLFLDPTVIQDTIRSQLNMIPFTGGSNFAPAVRWAGALGEAGASLVSRAIGIGLTVLVIVRRLDGPGGFILASIAPLFLTPQLWAHWFLIPAVAVLATAGEWRVVRTVDAALRRWMGMAVPAYAPAA